MLQNRGRIVPKQGLMAFETKNSGTLSAKNSSARGATPSPMQGAISGEQTEPHCKKEEWSDIFGDSLGESIRC